MELTELMSKVGSSLYGGRSFGPPIEHDGVMLIPVAYVIGGGGGGEGTPPPKREPQPPPLDAPSSAPRPVPLAPPPSAGSGGGFGFVSIPIGAYVVRGGDVTFRPSFDIGAILLLVRSILKTIRRKRHGRS